MEFSEDDFKRIIEKYQNNKKTQREYYHNVRKHNDDFKNNALYKVFIKQIVSL